LPRDCLPTRLARQNVERTVADPALRGASPRTASACGRPTHYPAPTRENVELGTIDRMNEDAIVTTDGRVHEVDAVVFATGSRSNPFLAPIRVRGPRRPRLEDEWADGARHSTVSGS